VSNFVHAGLARPGHHDIRRRQPQTRSFCYIDDLVDGLLKLMESPTEITGPVNLGNPVEFTMRELAEMTLKLTGSRSKLVFLPLPQDDPRQRQPDIAFARSSLAWAPTNSAGGGPEAHDRLTSGRCFDVV